MAFQKSAYQNLDTHGTKGFQTETGAVAADSYTQRHHHFYAHSLAALAATLWAWLAR